MYVRNVLYLQKFVDLMEEIWVSNFTTSECERGLSVLHILEQVVGFYMTLARV